ncbi:hypothetical protein BDV97DRAFT_352994 [Delphinella strobiligena]|nr:hypothetical protein BDV97DRAFT_352994 [Delphinella strobiligena]
MLNVRALNNLLSENADHKLFLRWFIMTPNGSLMAYTLPANMKELRDQVALVSISWKEHLERKDSENHEPQHSEDGPNDSERRIIRPDALETLTIEFDNRNLIVKYLQPKLLLVLEGGVPPGRRKPLHVTAEAPGDARYPPEDGSLSRNGSFTNAAALSSSVGSGASTTASQASYRRVSVLQIQRKKTEIMAQTIRNELQRSGFQMPDDPTNKFF